MDDRQSGIKTAPEARNGVSLQIKGMSCQVLWSDSASRPPFEMIRSRAIMAPLNSNDILVVDKNLSAVPMSWRRQER